MKTVIGEFTSAIIFDSDNAGRGADDYALAQIKALCDNKAFENCKIRVMPDVHPGMVGTIGFTSTLGNSVIPNVIGIDIGCGMTLVRIRGRANEFQKLDAVIRENVPSGFAVRKNAHHRAEEFDFSRLYCRKHINEKKALLSLGTLGGGNHFIEVDCDEDKNAYLIVHTGSRHLGKEVTDYYLNAGQRELKSRGTQIPYELTYLEGVLMENYLHDLAVVQEFAQLNREIIAAEILKGMKWKTQETYSCIHNYVDFTEDVPIVRKGAISAKDGERLIIPINMRDGVILGRGRGNPEWNFSAPHGAGRLMKREDVRQNFTLSAFKTEMKGIYSSCIGRDTLDEAPFAYRSIDDIAGAIDDTVSVDRIIRPVYNFKAGGEK